jgi:hypothetical protein
MKTLYDLLGVRSDASAEALKLAFHRTVRACHPDLHPGEPHDPIQCKEIVDAYAILSDAAERADYDHWVKLRHQRRQSRSRLVLAGGLAAVIFIFAIAAGVYAMYRAGSVATVAAVGPGRDPAGPGMSARHPSDNTSAINQDRGPDARAAVQATVGKSETVVVATQRPAASLPSAAATLSGPQFDRQDLPASAPAGVAVALPVTDAAPRRQSDQHPDSNLATADGGLNAADRAMRQMEWKSTAGLGTGKPVPGSGSDDVALWFKSGAALMKSGDVAIARIMLQWAAEAGDAAAAFALAETYDPLVLRKLGASQIVKSDVELARSWYENARNLGFVATPEGADITWMMKVGSELMASGEIVSARTMFQRAAEAGEAKAAFALAETYDPLVLEKLGAKGGIQPEITLAQSWYELARKLGYVGASERLERLAQSHR